MAQLATLTELINQGATLQNLRDKSLRTQILGRQSNTSRLNAETIAARNPILQKRADAAMLNAETSQANSITSRVNAMLRGGDHEGAATIINNSPANKQNQLTTKFFPKQKIFTRTNKITGESKSWFYEPQAENPLETVKEIPEAKIEGQEGLTGITNDVAQLTLQKQELIDEGVAEDSPEVQKIDEVIDAIQQGSGATNDIYAEIKRKHPGDPQAALDEFIKVEATRFGARSKAREIEGERGKKVVQEDREDRLSGDATARAQGKTRPKLAQQKTELRRIVDTINEIQDGITENPTSVSSPGALARTIVSLADQAANMAELFTPGEDLGFLKTVGNFAATFREAGIENAKLKARFLGLALGMATIDGFEGRAVTELKLQANLKRLGAALGSPQQIHAVLQQIKEEMAEKFKASVDAFNKLDGLDEPILGSDDAKVFTPQETSQTPKTTEEGLTPQQEAEQYIKGLQNAPN